MSDWDEKAVEAADAHHTTSDASSMWVFIQSARWQREALLADEVVERSAIALYEAADTFGAKKTPWYKQTAEVRADWTRHATTALTAAIEGEES